MDLVGVQRGIDFEHSLPTVMRYKPDIRLLRVKEYLYINV